MKFFVHHFQCACTPIRSIRYTSSISLLPGTPEVYDQPRTTRENADERRRAGEMIRIACVKMGCALVSLVTCPLRDSLSTPEICKWDAHYELYTSLRLQVGATVGLSTRLIRIKTQHIAYACVLQILKICQKQSVRTRHYVHLPSLASTSDSPAALSATQYCWHTAYGAYASF